MKIKPHILAAISVSCILYNTAYSQNPAIIFTDKASHQPLEFVSVSFWKPNNPKKITQIFTDQNGSASVNKKKGTILIVAAQLLGYKPVKDTIVLKSENYFLMNKDVLNLEQVTVTGTRTPHILKNSPVLTQMITAKEIENIDAQTLPDILEVEMPGMEMANHGGVHMMNMMGLETQYSLILIDGERLAKGVHKAIDYSRLNAANIEKIEIIRGASSALYGSDAMGGVINIITKNANKKFDIHADVRFQEMNSKDHTQLDIDNADDDYARKFYKNIDKQNINANLNFGFKGKKFSSSTFLNFKTGDAYKLKDSKTKTRHYKDGSEVKENMLEGGEFSETKINGFQDFTISQKLGCDISEKWTVDVSGNFYNHDEYDFANDAVHDLYQSYNAFGKTTYILDSKSSINLSFNTDIYQQFNYGEKHGEKNKKHSNNYNNAKLNFTTEIGKHTLFSEVENLYQTLTSTKFIADKLSDKHRNNTVFVLQDQFKWNEAFMLVAGVRTGYHSSYKLHVSPSLSAKYSIRKFNIRASYARGFRSPDLKELYMNWNHRSQFHIFGSKDLKPETSNYYSLSVDFVEIEKNINITLISSFNDVKDKIDGMWTNNNKEFHYVNYDNAKIFSLETLLKWQFMNHFRLKAGYIFLQSVKSEDAQDLSSMSPMSLNFQIEYSLTKNKYRLNANISGKITGKKTSYGLDNDEDNPYGHKGEYYEVRYPTYSIWNFSVNQRFGKHLKLGLGIKNILDYKTAIVTPNTNDTPGRRFFVSLGYSL